MGAGLCAGAGAGAQAVGKGCLTGLFPRMPSEQHQVPGLAVGPCSHWVSSPWPF